MKPTTDLLRSALMAKVRQSQTRPEIEIAASLRSVGLAYRRNVRSLPGSPDFANKKRKWAIFVNGCYWHHHHGCKRATIPKSNTNFWIAKFRDNRARDARSIRLLRALGYKVLVVWECSATRQTMRLSKVLESRRVKI